MRRIKKAMLASLGCTLLAAPLQAAVVPSPSAAGQKEYRSPALYVPTRHAPISALKNEALAGQLQQDLVSLGVPETAAFYDAASEHWGSLLPSEPLIPGTGVNNHLATASDAKLDPGDDTAFRHLVWDALLRYLQRHESVLRVDTDELAKPNMTITDGGALVQIWAPRRVGGVMVRDSSMVAVLNHGNLVLLGFQNWGPANIVSPDPSLSAEQACTKIFAARRKGSAPSRLSTAARSSPLTYSMMRKSASSKSPKSKVWTMLG